MKKRSRIAAGTTSVAMSGFIVLAGCSSSSSSSWSPDTNGVMSYFGMGRKDCVGTARNATSKVWFTVADGVLSDVYHPTVDVTNVQTMQYIVTDGTSFTDLQTRDMTYTVAADPTGMSCTITSTANSGKYRIVTTYVADPNSDTVATRSVLKPLTVPAASLKMYVRFDATVNGNGGGGDPASGGNAGADSATVDSASTAIVSFDTNTTTAAENATYIEPTYAAVRADKPFLQQSSGFAGSASDGLTQLDANHTLATLTNDANSGNVVQTAQIDVTAGEFRLALGLGKTQPAAVEVATGSLGRGYSAILSQYEQGWKDYDAGLKQPPASLSGVTKAQLAKIKPQYWQALNVIKASEDKTFPGAIAAGLAAPWGQAVVAGQGQVANQGQNVASAGGGALAPYFGSYREIFSRDLSEAAGTLLLAGDTATAQAAAKFVLTQQQQQLTTGQIPRNSLPNGKKAPDTGGTQLDESSFPILLAYQSGLGGDAELYQNNIRRAADFVVSEGPATGLERWEEQTGHSPSTIAAQIAGLVAAGRIAAQNGDNERSRHYLAVADYFQRTIKGWTVTTNGPYAKGRYFIRVSKTGNPNEEVTYSLGNGGPTVDQRSVIDQGFLELVRLGSLPASDPDILASLNVANETVRVDTPSGVGIHRYGTSTAGSEDGYGDCFTPGPTTCTELGKPWPGGTGSEVNNGTGHVWPLLSGERAEHAIGNGNDAEAGGLLVAMSKLAGNGGLLPEQDWTDAALEAAPYGTDPTTASIGFEPGRPAGSAMPLTWAEAQFARLVMNLNAGTILERPAIVTDRYVATRPPKVVPLDVSAPASGENPGGSKVTVVGTTNAGAKVVVMNTNLTTGETAVVSGTASGTGQFSLPVATSSGSTLTVTSTTSTGTGYKLIQVGPIPSGQ